MFGLALTSAQLNGSGLEGVGEARIEMSKNFGDISEKYLLSAGSDTNIRHRLSADGDFGNFRKYRRYFGICRYFTDFSGYFPIFPTSPAHARIQNLSNLF